MASRWEGGREDSYRQEGRGWTQEVAMGGGVGRPVLACQEVDVTAPCDPAEEELEGKEGPEGAARLASPGLASGSARRFPSGVP